jgi:WD40 repeat protein
LRKSSLLPQQVVVGGECVGVLRAGAGRAVTAMCVPQRDGGTGYEGGCRYQSWRRSFDAEQALDNAPGAGSGRYSGGGQTAVPSLTSVADSPAGGVIVSGGEDKEVRVWDMSNAYPSSYAATPMQPVSKLKGHRDTITCLQMNERIIVSASEDRTIKLWDLRCGGGRQNSGCIRTLLGHQGHIRHLQLRGPPGAMSIISASSGAGGVGGGAGAKGGATAGVVRIWDERKPSTSALVLKGHTGAINALSADWTSIATGSADHTVKLWSLLTGQLLGTCLHHNSPVVGVTLRDRHVVSSTQDGQVCLWRAELQ